MSDDKTGALPDKINFTDAPRAWLARFRHIPHSEKIFFVQHLGVMIKAGISLAKALKALEQQTKNKRLKKIINDVHAQILKGNTLADALKPHRDIFGELFVNMIEAGESSGTLENVLKQLYLQLKKGHRLNAKIRGALAYPMVILVAMGGIGAGVMVFVVPKFISIFEEVDVELPLMTRLLIMISNQITNNGLFVFIGTAIFLVAFFKLIKTSTGRAWTDAVIINVPVIAPIVKKINLARFARTMSSLLKTDIKVVECFHITANTLNNTLYRQSLHAAAERVVKGEEIHVVLKQYPRLYNDVIIEMVSVGEETGELDDILSEIADFYEEEVEDVMNALPTLIEPLIIIILAAAIGAMAVAIIMPMYSLTNAI